MKKPIIIGNWKTNPETLQEAKKNILAIEKKVKDKKQNYLLAVPDAYISTLKDIKSKAIIGAENISGLELGAYTGTTTASMLKSAGALFTILGHSEVRTQGETDEIINKKIKQSLASGLFVVICVGESIRDKEAKYLKVVEEQLLKSLAGVNRELFSKIIIAYEPIWAIGAKNPANTHECFEMAIAIRRALASFATIDYAKKVSIIYGGAVTEENSASFITDGGVDGLLVGRASLNPTSFSKIITNCYAK